MGLADTFQEGFQSEGSAPLGGSAACTTPEPCTTFCATVTLPEKTSKNLNTDASHLG